MAYNKLNEEEKRVIEQKGTEAPFTGVYNDFTKEGTFTCKKCGSALYSSKDKFSSGCGWPSFDEDLGTVKRVSDSDGRRVEILCNSCDAHLGHVFENEGFTSKNTRHCVNSISLNFLNKNDESTLTNTAIAYFAAGCFWGVEYYFQQLKGVKKVASGYMGGETINPSYESICTGTTGHLEVIQVQYDEKSISFENLSKYFFEIHDFSQENGQGPDIGSQYLSAIFYNNLKQKEQALKVIDILKKQELKVATSLYEAKVFYEAELYHQDYYKRHQTVPYCHSYKKIFD